jgi:hypothetical protein
MLIHAAHPARNHSLLRAAKKALYNRAAYLGQPAPRLAPGGQLTELNGKTFVVIEQANGGKPIVASVATRLAHSVRPASQAEADAVLAQLGLSVDLDIDAALDKLIELERARAADERFYPYAAG